MSTGLILAIIFNCEQSGASVIMFSFPNVRKFSAAALVMVKKEEQREAMAIEVCHPWSSSLRSSTGVQIRPKKMMPIWKADSNWASLKNQPNSYKRKLAYETKFTFLALSNTITFFVSGPWTTTPANFKATVMTAETAPM